VTTLRKHSNPQSQGRFEKTGEFFAVQNGVAYGWAMVSTEKGAPYWDLQDDHIPEEEMEMAALDFMKESRVGSDQHTGEHVGDIVFGFPVTKAAPALGIASDKTGFLIGYQPQDPVHLDMIAAGERTGFSIGGFLLDYDVSEVGKSVWSTAYQNNLPDASFLYVKAGGKKDADGKTTPRSLRMFPVKGADGKVDVPHLNNALARIAQSSLSAELKSSLTKKAEGLKVKMGKGAPDPSDVYTPSDIADKPKKKGKVYRRFKIDEISLVTKPAQEGATVGYVKGATIAKLHKSVVFTTEEEGHQHVVDLDDVDEDGCGCTSYARADGEDYGHSHDFIVDPAKLTITIGANSGHGHTATMPDPTAVREAGPPMPEQVTLAAPANKSEHAEVLTPPIASSSVAVVPTTPPEPTMTEAEIAALQKAKARAEKMAEMTDAQRSFVKHLSESDLESFIGKGASDREAVVKASIEFTAADGAVYYKHDDPRTIAMAKKADDQAKELVMEKALRKTAEFAKAAAEDMGNYPETDAVHAAVIQAIEGIADEPTRKAARTLIKAGDAAIAKASRSTGTNGASDRRPGGTGDELQKAETALKGAVETFAKARNISDYSVAFAEATAVDAASRDAYEAVRQLRAPSSN
jgi:hypothetical protein